MQAELTRLSGLVQARIMGSAFLRQVSPKSLAEACASYPARGGKSLRAAMLVWSCRMCGGPEEPALQAAAAVELFHAWTLVHDDIIDRDPMRRGGPAVHAAAQEQARAAGQDPAQAAHYGTSLAILAGDMQHGWAVSMLAALPRHRHGPALVRRLEGKTLREVIGGEMLDVDLAARPLDAVSEEDVRRVIARKTGALFAFAAWAGGMVAGASSRYRAALSRYGLEAGIGFQVQDDILGLVGRPEAMGKPVGSDLREAKRTLPLVVAWNRAGAAERRTIEAALRPAAGQTEIRQATAAILHLGGVAAAEAWAETCSHRARAALADMPPVREREYLLALAQKMIARDR